MKLTKMIYIASPYSYYHWCPLVNWAVRWWRYREVTRVIAQLQDKYPYAFVGPITQSHHTAKYMKSACTLFKSWKKRDLTYISRCDEVWVVTLPGWKESVGVKGEIHYAKWSVIQDKGSAITVRYVDPDTLEVTHARAIKVGI